MFLLQRGVEERAYTLRSLGLGSNSGSAAYTLSFWASASIVEIICKMWLILITSDSIYKMLSWTVLTVYF